MDSENPQKATVSEQSKSVEDQDTVIINKTEAETKPQTSLEIGEQAWQNVKDKASSVGSMFKKGWGNLKRTFRKDALTTLGDAVKGYRATKEAGRKTAEFVGDTAKAGVGMGLLAIESGGKFLAKETKGETWTNRAKELGNFVKSQWEKSSTRKGLLATKEKVIDTYEDAMDWKKQQADAVMARYYETTDAVYGWVESKTSPRAETAQQMADDASELGMKFGTRDYSNLKDKKLEKHAQKLIKRADRISSKASKKADFWRKLAAFVRAKRETVSQSRQERFSTQGNA